MRIDGQVIAAIDRGILLLIGIEKGDEPGKAELLAKKVSQLRMFEDEAGKSNLSVLDIQGEVLVVPQFTLAADVRKGTRPSFDTAEAPERAVLLVHDFVNGLKRAGVRVQEGCFGKHMEVELINYGPVTYILG